MAAIAVKEMSTLNQLPLISNGRLLACREPLPYTTINDLCTSLPPLPGYTIRWHGIARSRWGEDEDIERLEYGAANGGYRRYSTNIASCHPVAEDPDHLKYEGYMFPKPMHHDLTVLRNSVSNTSRRVPRDYKCEMFPRHDASRLYDGDHVLGEATRRAIEENNTRLYCTTRYNTIFKADITSFMVAKAQRDAQYLQDNGPDYIETPTCNHIHNHPDPCHYCWSGGCNTGFEAKVAEFQSRQYSSTKSTHTGYSGGKTEKSSAQHSILDPKDKHDCSLISDLKVSGGQTEICNCLNDTCVCHQNNADLETEHKQGQIQTEKEQNEKSNPSNQREGYSTFKDTFGPRQDNSKNRGYGDEQIIFTNVYQSKLPSSIHLQSTQNEYASDLENRHFYLTPNRMFNDQLKSLYRVNAATELHTPTQPWVPQKHKEEALKKGLPPNMKQTRRNSWMYRDENNLRIPCIADVIGSSNKSDAHKKYHLEHPEPIPDLRDNKKYSRRVKFNGFSSSVFR
ncbi:uncharacterized protein LOC123551466 isoform X2 [Mercenaria mercenaria]|uniref:uncharacterized protein LOC123551466 isoform X2 n=1 Tax=Mercenaria mercenaria TaxID=6596 RepID=UPI00234EDF2E|nr:uncharacterized protein LOC123551466 isoform X2 [Mercenaria mercenaria]